MQQTKISCTIYLAKNKYYHKFPPSIFYSTAFITCGRLMAPNLHNPCAYNHSLCHAASQSLSLKRNILHPPPLISPAKYQHHGISNSLERAGKLSLPSCSCVIVMRTYPSWPSGARRRMRKAESKVKSKPNPTSADFQTHGLSPR